MRTRATLGEILPISYGKARAENYGVARQETPVYGSSGRIGAFDRALTKGPALIVGRKGSAGAVYYAAEPCWPIDTVYFAEGNDQTHLPYFRYFLESLSLGRLDRSTAIPSLSRDDYNSIEVEIPSFDEQRRIVAEIEEQLSCLDAGVAALKRVQVNLKRYRVAAAEQAAKPAQAREMVLLDILRESFKTGLSIRGSEAEGIPSLKLSALRNGRIDFSQSKSLPVSLEAIEGILLQSGDFLVVRGNGSIRLVGAGALVLNTPRPTIYPDLMIRVRVKSDVVDPRWLAAIWPSRIVRDQIERKAKTTAGIHKISQRDLGSITLRVPPIAEQKKIVAQIDHQLSVVDELENQVRVDLARAERHRQSTLSRAFAVD